MDEFSQSDIVSIRNKSAFLMSILRQGVCPNGTSRASPPSDRDRTRCYSTAMPCSFILCFVFCQTFRKHHEARKKPGGGIYGHMGYGGMMGYGYMDPTAGSNPYSDYYGGAYGRTPHLFNAYGQPMAAFFSPHMPMCPPGNMEILPASIQLRLDHLGHIGFCQPGEIDDR